MAFPLIGFQLEKKFNKLSFYQKQSLNYTISHLWDFNLYVGVALVVFYLMIFLRRGFPETSSPLDSYLNEENEAEDARAWFPCPFCYVEIEVPMLCSHLQDEHCFDLKNAVCPICAATLGKDPTGHFSVQHAHLVKRRRNYLKPGFWNNAATAMIGKDPREIASFFGANSVFGRYKVQESAPDPLLLPFLCNFPPPDPKCRQQDKSSVCDTATTQIESSKLAVSEPALEEHFEEKRQKVAFLQELVSSTIF